MSPAIAISLRIEPRPVTPPCLRSSGAIRATGALPRRTTISSPASARRTSLEKWVFASWIVTLSATETRISRVSLLGPHEQHKEADESDSAEEPATAERPVGGLR